MIPHRLAAIPKPLSDESLSSWLTRLSLAHHQSPVELLAHLMQVDFPSVPSLKAIDRCPPRRLIAALERATGWPAERFLALVPPYSDHAFPTSPLVKACNSCLRADVGRNGAYLRRAWSHPWYVVCSRHLVPLTARCHGVESGYLDSAYDSFLGRRDEGEPFSIATCREMASIQTVLCADAEDSLIPYRTVELLRALIDLVSREHEGRRSLCAMLAFARFEMRDKERDMLFREYPVGHFDRDALAPTDQLLRLSVVSALWQRVTNGGTRPQAPLECVLFAALQHCALAPGLRLACHEVGWLLRGGQRTRWLTLLGPDRDEEGRMELSAAERRVGVTEALLQSMFD